MLPFEISELTDAVIAGDVTMRPHPSLPYHIYNYSPEVQFSKKWNKVTLNCRGLILDNDFNIVARPWKKFFNLGEVNLPIQFDDPVEVMDKADGSLGILYQYPPVTKMDGTVLEGEFAISTRGSFVSEQAIHATRVWRDLYADYYNDPAEFECLRDYTPLFEIIYPENRIVLSYDGMDDLILLGGVEKSTGHYVGPRAMAAMIAWPGPVVETYEFKTLSDANAHMGRANKEGFVIRSHNFMVKLKEPDYLELHRLVTNLTPRTVWEQLRAGKDTDQIVSAFPDEFHDEVKSMIEPLLANYDKRLQEILANYDMAIAKVTDAFAEGPTFPDRKDFALSFKKHKDAGYFFRLLDGKGLREVLWTELKPRETKEIYSEV